MKLERILPFAKILLSQAINEGDSAVDATVGNGLDTVFLANLVGETGHVFGFDIQKEAVEQTKKKLQEQQLLERTTLIHGSHATISEHCHEKIAGAIFNLGYLPNGDKSIVTKPASTISAIEQLFSLLKPEGIIVLVIYHGHPEGIIERDELIRYTETIDQNLAYVLRYQFVNQVNSPPFIIAIEKKK